MGVSVSDGSEREREREREREHERRARATSTSDEQGVSELPPAGRLIVRIDTAPQHSMALTPIAHAMVARAESCCSLDWVWGAVWGRNEKDVCGCPV